MSHRGTNGFKGNNSQYAILDRNSASIGDVKDDETEEDSNHKKAKDREVWLYKCARTAALTMALVAMGFDGCIYSPTIPDMRERLHVSMEEFARSSMSMSVGVMIGSVLMGVLCDRFHKYTDSIIALNLFVMGTCLILRPWSPSMYVLCINTFLDGFAGGAINAATNSIHLHLWGAKPMPMYIKNFGWTAACPLVPLLAKDFLSEKISPVNETMHASNISVMGNTTISSVGDLASPISHHLWEYGDNSRIEIPFAICGLVSYSIIPIYCFFQFKKSPLTENSDRKTKTSWREVFSLGSCAGGASCFSMSMLISLTTFYILIIASNSAMWDLLFSYVVDPRTKLDFTKDEASYLQTSQTSIYLVCRILTIFISPYIPIQLLLGGTIFLSFGGMLVFVVWGLHTKSMIWGCILFASFVQSPTWAAGILWAEHYINVYAIMIGFTDIGAGSASLVIAWVNGKLFDSDKPERIFYLALAMWICFCLHFIVIQTIASCHRRKYGSVKALKEDGMDPDTEKLLSGEDDDEEEHVEMLSVTHK